MKLEHNRRKATRDKTPILMWKDDKRNAAVQMHPFRNSFHKKGKGDTDKKVSSVTEIQINLKNKIQFAKRFGCEKLNKQY